MQNARTKAAAGGYQKSVAEVSGLVIVWLLCCLHGRSKVSLELEPLLYGFPKYAHLVHVRDVDGVVNIVLWCHEVDLSSKVAVLSS
jgi:hypothetical protein